jgi:hypothetical protein
MLGVAKAAGNGFWELFLGTVSGNGFWSGKSVRALNLK